MQLCGLLNELQIQNAIQQKGLLAKWLRREPRKLILFEGVGSSPAEVEALKQRVCFFLLSEDVTSFCRSAGLYQALPHFLVIYIDS